MSNNVLSFAGNLGADAEVRHLASGMAVLSFSVAMGSGFGDKSRTDWVRVSMFGKVAEGNLKNYLLKGTAVFVSGECSLNTYQANDGTTKASINMVANVCNLVGKKSDNGGQSQPAAATAPRPPSPHDTAKGNAYQSEDAPYDDDIPF